MKAIEKQQKIKNSIDELASNEKLFICLSFDLLLSSSGWSAMDERWIVIKMKEIN